MSVSWFLVLRRYIGFIAAANLLWEFAQFPLYSLWYEGTAREIVFAAIHCTGGDIMIAGAAIFSALLMIGSDQWPHARYRFVAAVTIVGGLGYTIFSEWLNTEIRGSWAYADLMPTLPLIGTGLSPFAQWIVVPLVGFWWARQPVCRCEPANSSSTTSKPE